VRPFFGGMAAFSPVSSCAPIAKTLEPWQVSWLKDGTWVPDRYPSPAQRRVVVLADVLCLQWRDRAGIAPASLLSPCGHPGSRSVVPRAIANRILRLYGQAPFCAPGASRRHSDGLTWMAASRPSFLAGPWLESVLLAELVPRTALLATIWRAAATNSQRRCDWFYFFRASRRSTHFENVIL
jgi:hypothetical protein